MNCSKCGALLYTDDIGIYKKVIDREAKSCFCKACLADYLSCDISVIERKINQFKLDGCLLFFPEKLKALES